MTQTPLPRFSIVLPSYNTVDYLKETVDSILNQDYPDIEFIVTDAQSTDGTLDLLRSYGEKIRWVSEPDDGQSDAINKGFALATGDLHYWANADDPIEPGTLRHVAELMTDQSRPQWLVGAARLIDEKGRLIGTRTVPAVTDTTFLLWGYKWIPTQSVFWNRKMWEVAGPFDHHLHYVMDLGLWERMHRAAPAIVTDRVLGWYRLHGDSKSLSSVERSRAERKKHLAQLMAGDIQKAIKRGNGAVEDLAGKYAHLFDELSDQAALVDRMMNNRLLGPVIRLYRKRVPWFPEFKD